MRVGAIGGVSAQVMAQVSRVSAGQAAPAVSGDAPAPISREAQAAVLAAGAAQAMPSVEAIAMMQALAGLSSSVAAVSGG